MKITPLDIYNKEFNKSTFGYKVSQVDEFLDEVGVTFEKLLKELNSLEDENEKLKERLKNYENIEDKLTETLTSVQETAREQTKQARKEADMIVKKAHMKADKIISETKMELQDQYHALEQLKETKEIYRIRFKSLLEGHLQMLKDDEEIETDIDLDNIAASGEKLDE